MNPILPTGQPLPTPAAVSPVGQILATLTQLPQQSLNNLLVGALLSGMVIGRDNKGQILLQTGQGVFGIKTSAPLPVGSTVTLEVQSAGAQLQTVVLSMTPPGAQKPQAAPMPAVFGPPVQEAPAPHAGATPAQSAGAQNAGSAATQAATTTAPQSTLVTATVIAPPGGTTPAASPQAQPAAAPASQGATIATPVVQTTPELPGSTSVLARPIAAPVPPAPTATATPAQTAATNSPIAILTPGTPVDSQAAAPIPTTTTPALPTATPTPAIPAPHAASAEHPALPTLPTGTQVQVRVLPEGHATANAPPGLLIGQTATTAATTVQATIVGRTPQGQTVVDTPVGRLAMTLPPTQESLPGKQLALELSSIARPASAEPPPLVQRHSAMSITHEWPALKTAVSAADSGNDHVLKMALDDAVPRPGPKLAQQLLQAVAGGDTRQALIESVVKPLERAGFTELAQRIEHDLQDLQKLGNAPGSEWRLSFVPFFDGQDVRQLRIFSRKKRNDPKRKGNEAGTRFVIECEHGELGALQLDGFLNKQNLDVIVRSHSALPAWMKGDMVALFTDACGAIGMNGHLQFNAVPTFPISPMDEIAGAGAGVLV